MARFVMALLLVQLLLGGYLLSFVINAGTPWAHARASRLPNPVVLLHLLMALAATGFWAIHFASDERGFAVAAFAALLLTFLGGAWMGVRTMTASSRVAAAGPDPADARVAEKQIPAPALVAHALIALTLVVSTGLVALGVAG